MSFSANGASSVREKDAGVKLAKYLMRHCDLSDCSHRHIKHNLLATDRVLVDGHVERNPSRRIRPNQNVVRVLDPTTLVYNKACGLLTALSDSKGIPCIGTEVSEYLTQYPGLQHVGRLDQHSCGLLLLTNDGSLTRILTDRKRGIPRRYRCVVLGHVDVEVMSKQMQHGVETRYGTYHGKLLSAAHYKGDSCIEYEHKTCTEAGKMCLRNDGPAKFEDGGDQYSHFLSRSTTANNSIGISEVVVEITEGQKREVRRILAYCGHSVMNLRREAFGKFELGALKAGELREATVEEMEWVMSLATGTKY